MRTLYEKLLDLNVGGLGVLVIVFAALVLQGANSAAAASLLTMALSMALAIAIFTTRSGELGRVMGANMLSIAAAFVFIALALISAAPGLPLSFAPEPDWTLVNAASAPLSVSPYRTLEGVVAFLAPCAAFFLALLRPQTGAHAIGRGGGCFYWRYFTLSLAFIFFLQWARLVAGRALMSG